VAGDAKKMNFCILLDTSLPLWKIVEYPSLVTAKYFLKAVSRTVGFRQSSLTADENNGVSQSSEALIKI
jgi:hypothetical protein